MHQGAVNAKSRRLFPGSAQQPSQKNVEPSKDQRLRGGEDRVGFVRNESAPDRKPDFWAVGRDQAGAADDDQWGVDARYEGGLVGPPYEGAVEPTWEVEWLWVMHLADVEERFEIAWGDTSPGPWRVSAGSGVSCVVSRRDLVTRLDGGRTFEGAM